MDNERAIEWDIEESSIYSLSLLICHLKMELTRVNDRSIKKIN